jgi:transposase
VAAVAPLAAAKLPVQAINPRQVRDFGKATGKLANTDAIDARVLAHFADAVRPTVRPLADAQTQALSMLIARRPQLVELLTAERNRRRALHGGGFGDALQSSRPALLPSPGGQRQAAQGGTRRLHA